MLLLKIIWQVIGAPNVSSFRQYEDVPVRVDHLNVPAIESGQDRAGHDFVDGSKSCVAAAKVKHTIEYTQQLIELMRTEQDGDPSFAAKFADTTNHDFLLAQIKTDQRLVK